MKKAQNVLFDLDGTISDPKEGITKSIAFALEKMGYTPPPLEELTVYIGPPLWQTFNALMNAPDEKSVEQAVRYYRQRYSDEGRGMVENILYPAIPETLKALKGLGKRIFITTSKAEPIANQIINHFGLSDIFDAVYGAEANGTRSDKTDLISYILERESIAPKDAVMIGDRKHDIVGALDNGVPAVGVLWGYGSAEELRNAGATTLCKKPEDLLNILSEGNAPTQPYGQEALRRSAQRSFSTE
ncbi:MAG: HAD family hydrolase [Alphaproteobacteria bacterium]|nr:HAD family hydrolase [Alphaproteobacteria bacterium]